MVLMRLASFVIADVHLMTIKPKLLIYFVLFVDVIIALPSFELIADENLDNYSTSFPRSPIPLIPSGTTHSVRSNDAQMTQPMMPTRPIRIMARLDEPLIVPGDMLYPALVHKAKWHSSTTSAFDHRTAQATFLKTVSDSTEEQVFPQSGAAFHSKITERSRESLASIQAPAGLKGNIQTNDEQISEELIARGLSRLPVRRRVRIWPDSLKETIFEDSYTMRTTTWRPTTRQPVRDIIRIFAQLGRWSVEETTTVRTTPPRVTATQKQLLTSRSTESIQYTRAVEPTPVAQFSRPDMSAGHIKALSVKTIIGDEQPSQTLEKNLVGGDGKRRIELRSERVIVDEVDIDSLSDNATIDTKDLASDDYDDFDKQEPANGIYFRNSKKKYR